MHTNIHTPPNMVPLRKKGEGTGGKAQAVECKQGFAGTINHPLHSTEYKYTITWTPWATRAWKQHCTAGSRKSNRAPLRTQSKTAEPRCLWPALLSLLGYSVTQFSPVFHHDLYILTLHIEWPGHITIWNHIPFPLMVGDSILVWDSPSEVC